MVWGSTGERASHNTHSKCGRCLLITFCGRLWLWKKAGGRWAEDYTEENWAGAGTDCGKRKGADGWGLAVGFSRPSCAALCCLRLLWLVQFRSLLLFFLLVFWDLPGEEGWGEFYTRFPACHHFLPHTSASCLEVLSLRCLASSTHLSCPLRCRLRCHTMSPMSRATVPRPPRIPRVRARVSSPGPSTEPVWR